MVCSHTILTVIFQINLHYLLAPFFVRAYLQDRPKLLVPTSYFGLNPTNWRR